MDQLDQLMHGKPQVGAPVPPTLDDTATVDDGAAITVDDHGTGWARAKDNLTLRRGFGRRIMLAREWSGLGQTQAALLMGWKNATQLSLIEQGKRMPPHTLLVRMSDVLGVSLDWLFGLDNEPERDSRSAAVKASVRQISRMLERNSTAVATALFDVHRYDTVPAIRASRLVTTVFELCDAVGKFRAADPKYFDNTRCSAMLLRTVDDARSAVENVDALLGKSERRTATALKAGRAALVSEGVCNDV